MASFHSCETYLLYIKLFVVNKRAISPFLGGLPNRPHTATLHHTASHCITLHHTAWHLDTPYEAIAENTILEGEFDEVPNVNWRGCRQNLWKSTLQHQKKGHPMALYGSQWLFMAVCGTPFDAIDFTIDFMALYGTLCKKQRVCPRWLYEWDCMRGVWVGCTTSKERVSPAWLYVCRVFPTRTKLKEIVLFKHECILHCFFAPTCHHGAPSG